MTTHRQAVVIDVTLPAAAPEPASVAIWSLLGLGLAGYGVYRAAEETDRVSLARLNGEEECQKRDNTPVGGLARC